MLISAYQVAFQLHANPCVCPYFRYHRGDSNLVPLYLGTEMMSTAENFQVHMISNRLQFIVGEMEKTLIQNSFFFEKALKKIERF